MKEFKSEKDFLNALHLWLVNLIIGNPFCGTSAAPRFFNVLEGGVKPLYLNGSPGRTRTADPVVNSHLLYQLSYRGTLSFRNIPYPT